MFDWIQQIFADGDAVEVVKGSKIVYLYRVLMNQATADGAILALTTENGLSISKDSDSTATKDGPIRTPGEPEIEITATSIFKKGDALIKTLKNAMLDDEIIEIWRANLEEPVSSEPSNTKFYGTYYQGYLTSFEETANAEDAVEYSLSFGINGKGADGQVTVNAEQQEQAQYSFVDTPAQTSNPGGA